MPTNHLDAMRSAFDDFVRAEAFPCVGAKAALAKGTIDFFHAERIDRPAGDLPLYRALRAFAATLDPDAAFVQSFVAVFEGPRDLSEEAFEVALWDRLQALHNIDVAAGAKWTEQSAADASSPHFSMSVGGQAFFVVGLHPNASRTARRFDFPILVFNSHQQFERLRADGRFDKMKAVIRRRDEALDGGINPMVGDYGEVSEARQYSGRQLPDDWTCPLAIQVPDNDR